MKIKVELIVEAFTNDEREIDMGAVGDHITTFMNCATLNSRGLGGTVLLGPVTCTRVEQH